MIISWSNFCHALTPVLSVSQPVSEPPDFSAVPPEYHNLAPVFSKNLALLLPPHRSYDCAIDLQPGAPLPTSRLYNLSWPESEAMEKYIQDVLPLLRWVLFFSLLGRMEL